MAKIRFKAINPDLRIITKPIMENEFKDLPSDTVIDEEETCFVCKKLINRQKPYMAWSRLIQKDFEILEGEEIALICSKECYNKFEWLFYLKGDKISKLIEKEGSVI